MSYVFVGGAARSGTTLLHSILCSTPATNAPVYEDSTIRHLAMSYEDVARMFDRHGRFIFTDRLDARRFHREMLLRYLAKSQSAWPGAQHLVVKHPLLTAHFPTLATLLPRARFVIAVRDPRAIIASLMAVAARGSENFPRAAVEREIDAYIARFRLHYSEAQRHFFRTDRERCLWVRYEDMVADPRGTAAQLGRFAGIDLSGYDPEAPWRGWADGTVDLSERAAAPYYSPLWGRPVSAERTEAWRSELSEAEAQEIARRTASFMRRFGYASEPPPPA